MNLIQTLRNWGRFVGAIAIGLFLMSGCGSLDVTVQNPTTAISETEASDILSSQEDAEFHPDFVALLQKLGPHGHHFTNYFTETTDYSAEFTHQEIAIKLSNDHCVPLELLSNGWILIQHYKSNPNASQPGPPEKVDYSLYHHESGEFHYLLTGDDKTFYLGVGSDNRYLLFHKQAKESLLFAIDTLPYTSRSLEGGSRYRDNQIVISSAYTPNSTNACNLISNGNVLFLEETVENEVKTYALTEFHLSDHSKSIIEDAIREDFMYLGDKIYYREFLSETEKVLRNQDGTVSYTAPAGISISPVVSGTRVFFMVEKDYGAGFLGTHGQLYEVFSDGKAPELVLETSTILRDFHTKSGFLKWSHSSNNLPFVVDVEKNKIVRFDGLTSLALAAPGESGSAGANQGDSGESFSTENDVKSWNIALGNNTLLLSITYADMKEEIVQKHFLLTRK